MTVQEKYANKYLKGGLTVINHLQDKVEKDFVDRGKFFYGMYSANECFIGYNGVYGNRDFAKLRSHARGMIDMDKYATYIDGLKADGTKQTSSKMNISYEPAMYLSKYRDIVIDKFLQVNTVPETVAVDELARKEKDRRYRKLKFMTGAETSAWLLAMGGTIPEEAKGFDGTQDVDVYYRMGGVRLGVEILMKDAIDSTQLDSGWDVLKMMWTQDQIDINAIAYDVVHNRLTGRMEYVYVDPARCGMRNSIYSDARDSDFKFYIETKNLSQIMSEAPDLTEAQIEKIRASSRELYGWMDSGKVGRREYYTKGNDMWDSCRTDVMKLYFIDRTLERYVSGVHPMGNRIFDKVGPDAKLSGRDAKTKVIEEYIKQNLYSCYWVVGTDVVYNYGMESDAVYEGEPGKRRPIIPLVTYVGHEPSIIERCIGFDDDIQLATLKKRQAIAKIPPPPRMIFDQSAMDDTVEIAKKKYSLLEQLNMFSSSGVLVVKSTDAGAVPGLDDTTRTKPPFTFLPSGVLEDIQIYDNTIAMALDGIRQVTGINPIADGTNTQPDLLKGVMTGMNAATNSALMPHIRSYISTLERGYSVLAKKWVKLVASGEITVNNVGISGEMFKNSVISSEISEHTWSISVNMESREDRQLLLQDLMSKKDFLSPDIYYVVYNCIKAGDTKKAQLILAKHTIDAQEQAHAKQMQLVEAQSQGNAMAAERAMKAETDKIVVEYTEKAKLNDHQTGNQIKVLKEQYALQGQNETQKEVVKSLVDN